MRVLLTKDVKSLGKAGEIKEVKDGYGKNFLIAKGFAKHATDAVIEEWKAEQARLAKEMAQEVASLEELKAKLEELTLKITHKLGANGVLFGSITNKEIASELEAQHNITIDKKNMELKSAIKSTGVFEIKVKLGHAINAQLSVEVEGI